MAWNEAKNYTIFLFSSANILTRTHAHAHAHIKHLPLHSSKSTVRFFEYDDWKEKKWMTFFSALWTQCEWARKSETGTGTETDEIEGKSASLWAREIWAQKFLWYTTLYFCLFFFFHFWKAITGQSTSRVVCTATTAMATASITINMHAMDFCLLKRLSFMNRNRKFYTHTLAHS